MKQIAMTIGTLFLLILVLITLATLHEQAAATKAAAQAAATASAGQSLLGLIVALLVIIIVLLVIAGIALYVVFAMPRGRGGTEQELGLLIALLLEKHQRQEEALPPAWDMAEGLPVDEGEEEALIPFEEWLQ